MIRDISGAVKQKKRSKTWGLIHDMTLPRDKSAAGETPVIDINKVIEQLRAGRILSEFSDCILIGSCIGLSYIQEAIETAQVI